MDMGAVRPASVLPLGSLFEDDGDAVLAGVPRSSFPFPLRVELGSTLAFGKQTFRKQTVEAQEVHLFFQVCLSISSRMFFVKS